MGSTTLFCIVIPLILIVGIFIIADNSRKTRATALDNARRSYENALTTLKTRPTDPDLRMKALEAGRAYASVSRDSKGTTIFDEAALKNDLDAVTAGAGAAARIVAPPPMAAPSIADRLRQLDGLKAQGLVTEDEYQARRTKILESM